MFTGIIEEIGTVKEIRRKEESASLVIAAQKVMQDLKEGDSVAVNGVCLTVTSLATVAFTTDVIPETLRRSNLDSLGNGSKVNLERALSLNGRLGGHIVMGHIDGTGRIVSMAKEDNAVWVIISTDGNLLRYIVTKGSIAIDGVSLTVAGLEQGRFSVSIIPFTRDETTLLLKKPGDTVNLECDVLGKYVERLLGYAGTEGQQKKSINWDLLKENGFL